MATDRPGGDVELRPFLDELARRRQKAEAEFDAVVVGTGFAGAVTACRLVEAGFKICILERGRRYRADDFPRYPSDDLFASDESPQQQFAPPPDFSRWFWRQDHGLYDVRDLGAAIAVQASGYGGGSLIYANVHLRPPDDVFENDWPEQYRGTQLQPHFDLAAYMLGAEPIPKRLAKALQLQRAAKTEASWFRTPLAINFTGRNDHGRTQNPCDMRARCWRGCDHQAKNSLDLNYLARAEDGDCDIRTMAEVTAISRSGERFVVHYNDLLRRRDVADESTPDRYKTQPVGALYVFLCAGAVNTTELLFKSADSLWGPTDGHGAFRALGSRYFPNSDSLAAVFDCDEPHEADYGPTITSALLYDQDAGGDLTHSIDFEEGRSEDGPPPVGARVISSSGGTAVLAHEPILDWGSWTPSDPAAGTIVLTGVDGAFDCKSNLRFDADSTATAIASSSAIRQRHWFLVEDGGYPTDVEPLVGVFRSPLWLRRNRYLETVPLEVADPSPSPYTAQQTTPIRRPPAGPLRVGAFAEAVGATATQGFAAEGTVSRTFTARRFRADIVSTGTNRELLLPGLLSQQLETIFPPFFVQALKNDRMQLVAQAAAFALPTLSRILDDLSETVATQIDPDTRARLSREQVDDRQLQVLIRGLVRQVLQILAGSEVTLANKAAQALLNPVPETPGQVVNLLANVLLWAIGYDTNVGHTAMLLTMGRDAYRGRLTYDKSLDVPLQATLPTRMLDSASAIHERVLREIAIAWRGELRTNPGWTTLGKRITVHSQGGCPMGDPGKSVTKHDGEVHGCDGLYVMDGAAFPTSVGVNPSATIAAVAEYKVERFIRKMRPGWRARDHEAAEAWMADGRRKDIDPLNSGHVRSRPAPAENVNVLGLTFAEEMHGFSAPISQDDWNQTNFATLSGFPRDLTPFLEAESKGIKDALPPIDLRLIVHVRDLGRLVTADPALEPVSLMVSGFVIIHPRAGDEAGCRTFEVCSKDSFVQIFVRPTSDDRRFFRYHLRYFDRDESYVLDGVKVLCDAPGFDAWHDTSTLYFQHSGPDGLQRGVVRLSIETFVRLQLPSMLITGTTDPARQSWALLAFWKYFAGELADIYMKRADALKDALIQLLTRIHV